MASKVCDEVLKVISPIIDELGYDIVDVEFVKRVDGMNLEITIDGPNGINIDDCEKVHRAIDEPLDEANPTDDKPYILSVSSPGLDRPVKNHYDFLRNKDKLVEVKLYSKLDGKKSFEGLLREFNEEVVILDIAGQEKTFAKDLVACVTPVIEF